ncbi:MAG TPA: serine hydrolase [Bacillota bacterium]|nr:serine hydrolase [Bacillota bacterium]
MKELEKKIEKHISEAGGTWGIYIENLTKKETWSHLPDEVFPAASIIKIPIMMAAFEAHHQGKFSMEDTLPLRAEELVGGAGVFQHMTPGTLVTVYDTIMLMMIQSDNTATNMIIDLVGKENIQKTMTSIGLKDSTFYNKLMTVPCEREGPNEITARDVNTMLKTIATGSYTSVYACEHMIDIMKRQQDDSRLPARLPRSSSGVIGALDTWNLAHKTGSISGVVHDAGILYVQNQEVLITVLSKNVDDYFGQSTIATIGKDLFEALTSQ